MRVAGPRAPPWSGCACRPGSWDPWSARPWTQHDAVERGAHVQPTVGGLLVAGVDVVGNFTVLCGVDVVGNFTVLCSWRRGAAPPAPSALLTAKPAATHAASRLDAESTPPMNHRAISSSSRDRRASASTGRGARDFICQREPPRPPIETPSAFYAEAADQSSARRVNRSRRSRRPSRPEIRVMRTRSSASTIGS